MAEATNAASGGTSASARLRFTIALASELFLAVGTGAQGAPRTNNSTVDTITFTYTSVPAIGTGAAPATTTNDANGTVTNDGVIRVRVFGNVSQIVLVASSPTGTLASGANTIPLTQISAVTSQANLPWPPMPTGAGTGAAVFPAMNSARITQRTANWTFSYANTVVRPAGTYTGQVTYTATMP